MRSARFQVAKRTASYCGFFVLLILLLYFGFTAVSEYARAAHALVEGSPLFIDKMFLAVDLDLLGFGCVSALVVLVLHALWRDAEDAR